MFMAWLVLAVACICLLYEGYRHLKKTGYLKMLSVDDMNPLLANLIEPPLFKAIRNDDYDGVKFQIVNKGVDVNLRNERGDTALIIAACEGRTHIGLFLLRSHADYNAQEKYGNTALHEAVLWKHKQFVKMLLDYFPRTDIKNAGGNTALMLAEQEKDPETGMWKDKDMEEIAFMIREMEKECG